MSKKQKSNIMIFLLGWGRKILLIGGFVVAALWGGALFFLSDADEKAYGFIHDQIVQWTSAVGFNVAEFIIQGQEKSDPDLIMALINTEAGDPLFSINPGAVKQALEKMEWVDKAHVERQLPDKLYVKLIERIPMALWNNGKKLHVLDTYGDVIRTDIVPYQNLLIVSGDQGPKNTAILIQELEKFPDIMKKIKAANFIDQRRWNLKTTQGTIIQLPAQDVDLALERLMDAAKKEKILEKDLVGIDLRQSDRIIVKTKPGAVQEYKTGMTLGQRI